jgi:2-oxoisovalerate dehydrogenase E1 component
MGYTINRVTVIGAGTMGATIAAHLSNIGIPVFLLDIVPQKLTSKEEDKGLTLDHPAVRNRIVNEGWQRCVKARPANLFTKDAAERVTLGNLGATGIVGGNIPVAVGAALAQKLKGTDRVVLCFFGDGASNTGNFHEALNMASLWDLPVVFVVENNQYAMSVPWAKASKLPDVATRARAYGIPGEVVDGMNVLSVRGAAAKGVERARSGEGPTLIEAKTYRWYGHSHSDPRAYRTREEEKEWKDRDPIKVLAEGMMAVGMLEEKEFEELDGAVKHKLDLAMEYSEASPEPDPNELYTDVYAPYEYTQEEVEAERRLRDRVHSDPDMRVISYAPALQEAMHEEMRRDENVFLMGEDIGLYGGAYGATRGLWEAFGEWRVLDTPISEATIGGAAVGAAMAGLRPVAEIMYVDFTPLAMDQIANQGAKNRYMFGGKTTVPMVIRTEGGAGRAIAAHHSQSLESLWTHFPGIYVVMPATPYDAKGLLKAAIRDDNPVMFIEHKMLYKEKGPVPEEEYIIPLGVADIKREGGDVTVVTYSRMVLRALEAAEILAQEGIDLEVIDLRTLKPLDIDTVSSRSRRPADWSASPRLTKIPASSTRCWHRLTSWPSTGWMRRWFAWRRLTCRCHAPKSWKIRRSPTSSVSSRLAGR